jgi:hypothetical protein
VKNDCKYRELRNLKRLGLNLVSNILYLITYLDSNSGRRTPGVDGLILDSPKTKLICFMES